MSNGEGAPGGGAVEVIAMPGTADAKSNPERLLMRLEDSSLAARLVRAYQNRDQARPSESMKAVLQERIEQARASFDDAKD
jgi:hypothetical protein